MSTLTVYPDAGSGGTSVDGTVGRDIDPSGENWSTIRAGAGNFTNKTGTTNQLYYIVGQGVASYKVLARGIATFDTSPLTAGATVTAATLSFYGSVVRTDWGSPAVNIVVATPAADNDLVNADFSQLGTTTFSTAITAASFSTSAYNDFVLNASGLANIDKTGVSCFGTRESTWDITGTDPLVVSNGDIDKVEAYNADNAGTTNDPKLVITYTPGASGPANLKTYNTNVKANIKTINTNAIANVKTLDTNV